MLEEQGMRQYWSCLRTSEVNYVLVPDSTADLLYRLMFMQYVCMLQRQSKVTVTRPAWEWNDIPNVLHTSAELDQPLKAKAEASMRNRPIPPQIQVPPVVFRVQT